MQPIPCRWDGETFRPLPAYKRLTDDLDPGQVYRLSETQDRSQASHNHYHATVADGWANLPDAMAARFPSPEHLRKYALIRAGYADCRQIVAATEHEAQRMAAFVSPMDPYAVVTVECRVVSVWTAQSQSYRKMGKAAFEASKAAVMAVISEMLGVSADALRANTLEAA